MSLTHRNKAKEVIAQALDVINGQSANHLTNANYILNQLMKAGYTNDKIVVTNEELDEAYGPFVTCRIDESMDPNTVKLVGEHNTVEIVNLAQEEIMYQSKDVYLKHPTDPVIIGVHTNGFMCDGHWNNMEAWINVYNEKREFEYSAARVFGPIEDEVAAFERDGWTVIEKVGPK